MVLQRYSTTPPRDVVAVLPKRRRRVATTECARPRHQPAGMRARDQTHATRRSRTEPDTRIRSTTATHTRSAGLKAQMLPQETTTSAETHQCRESETAGWNLSSAP